MRMYDLIEKKKQGLELSRDELFEMIRAYTDGEIPDYQMSAFLMAVCFRSMTDRETFDLTEAMATSGDTVDLSAFGEGSVDKHSTGGVGDKTTPVVAPLVAAAGGIVAKMSGRGLGHTGGTVDKLESFPGFRTSLTPDEFTEQVKACGVAVIGQSANLAPADKKLYALRDVTATVDSLPLIASSIMSKKLAAGTRSIVLDVKYGSGAFMHTPEQAERLAEMMVRIGKAHGRNTAAIISSMDTPLGHAVGNTLEIGEAIAVLRGNGPDDLRQVCLILASTMLSLSKNISLEKADALAQETLTSGKAYEKFCQWIAMQGGDADYARNPEKFGTAAYTGQLLAERDGYLAACNAQTVGNASVILGAGRKTKDSPINHRAGVVMHKKAGDNVRAGECIATLYTEDLTSLSPALDALKTAVTYSDTFVQTPPLIHRIIR